jgi:hypothetical protein
MWSLVALYFSLEVSKWHYFLSEKNMTIRRFMKKDAVYSISDMSSARIKKIFYPIFYIQILLKNKKNLLFCLLIIGIILLKH